MTIGSTTANQGVLIALGGNQTWNIGSGGLTTSNVISGSNFGITRTGSGTLNLNAQNTFSGGITLNAVGGQLSTNLDSVFTSGGVLVSGGFGTGTLTAGAAIHRRG